MDGNFDRYSYVARSTPRNHELDVERETTRREQTCRCFHRKRCAAIPGR